MINFSIMLIHLYAYVNAVFCDFDGNNITQTCPCNILRYFMAVKMDFFR